MEFGTSDSQKDSPLKSPDQRIIYTPKREK